MYTSLQANGLKVLSRIPGLVESIEGAPIERMIYHSVLPEDEGLLGKVRITGPIGVQRPTFHRRLVDLAQEHGVEIVWGHQLVALEQHEESVTVTFQNGKTDTASFVVGCDGIHSNTRACLFGKEAADFTGLIQVS